jgi:ParB-like chromosome segregation protein Spo0J
VNVEQWPLDRLIEYARNPRKNDHAVEKIAAAIHEFGFRVPILAKSDGLVIDGHLRLKAARKLGLETVPVILADDMTDNQVRAFRLSVNKMADLAEWDEAMLALEVSALQLEDFDLSLTGFEPGELDVLINGPDFEPGSEDDQGKLDELAPKIVKCPHCGEEFDSREQG